MPAKPDRVRMTVMLDVASDPITGALDAGSGSTIEFAGWLEFMSVLETACAEAGRPEALPEQRGSARG